MLDGFGGASLPNRAVGLTSVFQREVFAFFQASEDVSVKFFGRERWVTGGFPFPAVVADTTVDDCGFAKVLQQRPGPSERTAVFGVVNRRLNPFVSTFTQHTVRLFVNPQAVGVTPGLADDH